MRSLRETSAGIIVYRKTNLPAPRVSRQAGEGIKFLLLYHGNGYWNFPKGGLEKGESSIQAALREVKEETGVSLKSVDLEKSFKISEKYFFVHKRKKIFKIVDLYLASVRSDKIEISPEHEGFGWFLYKDAVKLLKHRGSIEILKKSYDFLNKNYHGRSRKETKRNRREK